MQCNASHNMRCLSRAYAKLNTEYSTDVTVTATTTMQKYNNASNAPDIKWFLSHVKCVCVCFCLFQNRLWVNFSVLLFVLSTPVL